EPEAWRSAVSVAEAASREWSRSSVAEDPQAVARIADLLVAERSAWGQAALRDALPYIIVFFLAGGPIPALKPIYENLFLILALDDFMSLAQFSGLLAMADAQ